MNSKKTTQSVTKLGSEEYEGHRIDILEREGKPELVIDNVRVGYGRLPNGKFFLDDYAYDWTDDLQELARRYIAYQRRVDEVRAESSSQERK
jgi:hypothetical protein